MFITVRYGQDHKLLCNPQCSVNNLLDHISRRCGLINSGKILDLSDETGLVLGLNNNKDSYSDVYLKNHSTYILVEQQIVTMTTDNDDVSVSPRITYVPLLENYSKLLPKYRIHASNITESAHAFDATHQHHQRKVSRQRVRSGQKSPPKKTKRGKVKTPRDSQ